MIGAIEFMRAWRDMCKKSKGCEECAYHDITRCLVPELLTDAEINDLIGRVMAWKKRQEASNE